MYIVYSLSFHEEHFCFGNKCFNYLTSVSLLWNVPCEFIGDLSVLCGVENVIRREKKDVFTVTRPTLSKTPPTVNLFSTFSKKKYLQSKIKTGKAQKVQSFYK